MATPARFPFGVSTENTGPLKNFGLPNPAKWHVFFDDFDRYAAGDWVITTTEAGASSATEALTDGDGGWLLITNDSADDDLDFFQSVGEGFLFASGKKLVFEARFKVSDATESDFVMGLQIRDTTPLAVTDGVYFQKDDGDANLDFHVTKNSTSTSATAVTTVVSDTFITVGFAYNGVDEIKYFINGAHYGTSAVTNLVDDEALTVSFGIQNGAAAAKTMTIDYILAAKER